MCIAQHRLSEPGKIAAPCMADGRWGCHQRSLIDSSLRRCIVIAPCPAVVRYSFTFGFRVAAVKQLHTLTDLREFLF